ncbi:hypothetical protein Hanom_Chr11g01047701 [Helianthus anomalus]
MKTGMLQMGCGSKTRSNKVIFWLFMLVATRGLLYPITPRTAECLYWSTHICDALRPAARSPHALRVSRRAMEPSFHNCHMLN